MQTVFLTGMVLSAIPMGDFDKRIVILTKERGKITAFAKGARRQTSPLLAATNLFSFGEFEVYEGRSSYNLMKANISNHFMELTKSLDVAYYGFYFMEVAEYFTNENSDELMMLKLLYQSLKALTKENLENRLVRVIFEWKTLVFQGEYPDLFHCIICGSEENSQGISISERGSVCIKCKNHVNDYYGLMESTIYTLQFITATPIEKLFTFQVSEEVLRELEFFLKKYYLHNVEKKFKSLEIIEKGDFLT